MSLGVSFETYLRRRWDVQRDVAATSPRRLNAGWGNTNHELVSNIDVEKTCFFNVKLKLLFFFFFFYLFFFLLRTFTIHTTAGEVAGIYLTPLYHFHPLHRHLDITRAITAESSPLHIASRRTSTRNLRFSSASR